MLLIILVAIALSMDAFSLSLAYGTIGFDKKKRYLLSLIVGLYHLIMPLIGIFLGSIIVEVININPRVIAFVILFFIGVEMIISSLRKEAEVRKVALGDFIIFGFAVSIDSFSVGIGLEAMTDHYLLAAVVFALCSFTFTLLGLIIGYRVNKIMDNMASLGGGILLLVISFYYLFS